MEWTRIEEKWNEMAQRLQSAKGAGGSPKANRSAERGLVEPTQTEPSSLTGDTPSGASSAPLTREVA